MSEADVNFIQVMATVLIGTFIAYSVDLRAERRLEPREDLNATQRQAHRVSTTYIDYGIPSLVVVGLLVLIFCVTNDALPAWARTLIQLAGAVSVVALGANAIFGKIYGTRNER